MVRGLVFYMKRTAEITDAGHKYNKKNKNKFNNAKIIFLSA